MYSPHQLLKLAEQCRNDPSLIEIHKEHNVPAYLWKEVYRVCRHMRGLKAKNAPPHIVDLAEGVHKQLKEALNLYKIKTTIKLKFLTNGSRH